MRRFIIVFALSLPGTLLFGGDGQLKNPAQAVTWSDAVRRNVGHVGEVCGKRRFSMHGDGMMGGIGCARLCPRGAHGEARGSAAGQREGKRRPPRRRWLAYQMPRLIGGGEGDDSRPFHV